MVASEMSRVPLTAPRPVTTDWMAATERALPCPPAAGISAARHQRCEGAVASRRGDKKVRMAIESSGMPAASSPSGGITTDTRCSSDSGSPMKKSAPSGPAISEAKNVPMVVPVIRRTTSPIRLPWVTA